MYENPQVKILSNEGVRPTMNLFAAAYFAGERLLAAYDAQHFAETLPDDPDFSNFIADGSETDGRPPLSVGGLKLTLENVRAITQQLKLVQAGTGLSMIDGVLSIAPHYTVGE